MAAANTKAMMPAAVRNDGIEIPITDTTMQTFITAGANGYLIKDILVTNQDNTNARSLELWLNNTSADFLVGSYEIPPDAGYSNTAAVELLSALKQSPFLLQAAYILKVKAVVALTSPIQCLSTSYDYAAL